MRGKGARRLKTTRLAACWRRTSCWSGRGGSPPTSRPGPTVAHAAIKAIVRAQADHGTRGADERSAELTSHLFETEDCRHAVQSFLHEGPGKATFTGKL